MHVKLAALIAGGIVLALGGAFGTFHYTRALELELASARSSLRAFGETVEVPLVARDIAPGAVVSGESFVTAKIPASYLPANVLRALPGVEAEETLVALTTLKAGNALFDTDIALSGTSPRGVLMPVGNSRIFAISPRNLADFSGQLAEGTRVDIVWTQNIGAGKSETRLLATGLRVRTPMVDQQSSGAVSALADKLLLEGDFTDAIRGAVANHQAGFMNIILSDGSRSLNSDIVVIGPTDLEKLPLTMRGSDIQDVSGTSIIGKITGQSTSRERCPTAVIRGGSRSVSEVPC
ncbi:hypothetical protein HOY34_19020 [Xinfangfangia sp. D13-10-4-6]|uniref:SAF domain-containing protein n=1 Tax=Pseudogemmobacter hezensis TaxID=2737662 RepID=UPI001551A6C7|nr:SAF domain-containing protein [Pseudogemmobacter hezensis]NPD17283.1 hypothetical protein [Pseudogemmobacter hezensis]